MNRNEELPGQPFCIEYLDLDGDEDQIIRTQVVNVGHFVPNRVFSLIHILEG